MVSATGTRGTHARCMCGRWRICGASACNAADFLCANPTLWQVVIMVMIDGVVGNEWRGDPGSSLRGPDPQRPSNKQRRMRLWGVWADEGLLGNMRKAPPDSLTSSKHGRARAAESTQTFTFTRRSRLVSRFVFYCGFPPLRDVSPTRAIHLDSLPRWACVDFFFLLHLFPQILIEGWVYLTNTVANRSTAHLSYLEDWKNALSPFKQHTIK